MPQRSKGWLWDLVTKASSLAGAVVLVAASSGGAFVAPKAWDWVSAKLVANEQFQTDVRVALSNIQLQFLAIQQQFAAGTVRGDQLRNRDIEFSDQLNRRDTEFASRLNRVEDRVNSLADQRRQ